ncbi:MAG: type II secretion system GspH family protein [Oscillospiraceae bacterium]|nr:type II secretion system GspH family protein [Oscillospiraceae bacterium]
MKSKLNGFTLVELIVVMALMAILMVAIMNMFRPIRETYVDSTQYEAQRTAQNGVVQYITESVRYATDLGIYNTSVSSAQDAVEFFATEYCKNAGILDKTTGAPVSPYTSDDVDDITAEIQKYAEVIIIDNDTAHYNKGFWGRIIRRKVDLNPATASAVGSDPTITTGIAQTIDVASMDEWRTALGEAYYGENTFQINIIVNDTDSDGNMDGKDGMLNVSVVSTRNGKRDISNAGKENNMTGSNDTLTAKGAGQITRGGVLCRNLVSTGSNGVKKSGVFDFSKYSGSSNTPGVTTYIVFLNNNENSKEKDLVEKVVKTVKDSHS